MRWERGKLFNARNMEELEPFLDDKELREMLSRKTCDGVAVSGSRCFVGDMTDLLGEWVPDVLLDRLFAVMALRKDVTWQVLTKRAERMSVYATASDLRSRIDDTCGQFVDGCRFHGDLPPWPLPNVHLGVSVESQEYTWRLLQLARTPAAVRFVSAEPLLGALDLTRCWDAVGEVRFNALTGLIETAPMGRLPALDQVICGGESGRDARPLHPDWARSLRDQCQATGVSYFHKQNGEWLPIYDRDADPDARVLPDMKDGSRRRWLNLAGGHGFHGDRVIAVERVGKKAAGRLLDGRTWDEFPNTGEG